MIEQEIIAACFRDNSLRHELSVKPHHFASQIHGDIWAEIQAAGDSFDAVTVMTTLNEAGKLEAADRVITIANESIGTVSTARQHAQALVSQWRKREVERICAEGLETLDAEQVLRGLLSLDQDEGRWECSIRDAMKDALADFERAADGMRGITTGLADLDRHLGGWHDGDLSVIGARPAMGKTALLLHFAQKCGVPCGLVSAEQPAYQVAQRHVSAIGKVSLSGLRQGKIGEREVQAVMAANRMMKDYWIYDAPSPSIDDVTRVARRWKAQHGIRVLFVDYIQRLQGRGDRRVEQVGDVVRGLKSLARDLKIPVVALAQVARSVESRENRRPSMGDLSDSSEIEKEADQVITMYRDEVYNPQSTAVGECELKIAKNRHGYTGTISVAWHGETVSFGDLNPW